MIWEEGSVISEIKWDEPKLKVSFYVFVSASSQDRLMKAKIVETGGHLGGQR